jgi:hypothetical protein
MELLRVAAAAVEVEVHLLKHRDPSSELSSAPSSVPSLAPFPEEPAFVNAQITTTITLVLCALFGLLALSIIRHNPIDRNT